jgi:AAHS family 4-hydroxybenzoate transporter-like MFS transporter
LPESPKFSLLRGRTDEVKAILSKLRPERAELYLALPVLAPQISARASVSSLVSIQYRQLSLAIWLTSFLSLFCIFGLSGWIPTLMQARGESFATSFAFGALMQIMSLVGGLICGYIVDRRGAPRAWLSAWWLGGALAVGGLIFFHGHLSNLVCSALAGFCIIGAQFVLNNFTAHSYETDVRATAVGMELGVGRLGAILGPFIGGTLQQMFPGENVVLTAMSAAAAAAGIGVLFAIRKCSSCSTSNEMPSTNANARPV